MVKKEKTQDTATATIEEIKVTGKITPEMVLRSQTAYKVALAQIEAKVKAAQDAEGKAKSSLALFKKNPTKWQDDTTNKLNSTATAWMEVTEAMDAIKSAHASYMETQTAWEKQEIEAAAK